MIKQSNGLKHICQSPNYFDGRVAHNGRALRFVWEIRERLPKFKRYEDKLLTAAGNIGSSPNDAKPNVVRSLNFPKWNYQNLMSTTM